MPPRVRLSALGLLWLVARAAAAQQGFSVSPSQGVPLPGEAFGLDDEATALSGNPGGLAFVHSLELDYVRSQAFGVEGQSGDALFAAAGFGRLTAAASVEWLVPSACGLTIPCQIRSRRYGLGVGARLGWLGLGVTRHSFSSSESYLLDQLSSFDLGLMARPFRWLSVSLSALDVDSPGFGGVNLQRRFAGGLAVRPLGERLSLGADVAVLPCSSDPRLAGQLCGATNLGWRFTADWAMGRGLRAIGQASYDGQLARWQGQLGLAVDLGNVGVTYSQALFTDHGAMGNFKLRVSQEAWPSLETDHAALVNLDEALRPQSRGLVSLVLGGASHDPHAATLEVLRRLAADPNVAAVVLRSSGLPGSLGRGEELRSALDNLRAAHKKVLFLLESGGDLDYYVASAADRILAAPQAVLAINGFSATALFAAAGLAKLGVKAEFVRVGAYKNAPDTFTRADMSAEQREVEEALLGDAYTRFVHAVAERRHLDEAKVRELLDRGLLRPQEAVDAGLLDGLSYPDQLEAEVNKGAKGRHLPLREVSVPGGPKREERWGTKARIALVRVEGNIAGGESHGDALGAVTTVGSETVVRQIRRAANDPRVRAIVLRIDSPGGDGTASDLIWRELIRARKEKGKPVVASMGDVAASGGYYVAVGCDAIYAEPSTITGSIGVFVPKFDASGLWEKLGLHFETVKRGASADLFGIDRPLTDTERKTLQAWVDDFYDQFISRVAENRGLTKEAVDKIARGRVWSGSQALDHKLVDKLGSLEDALAEAARRAGLSPGEEIDVEDHGHATSLDLTSLAGAAVLEPALSGTLGVLPRREALRVLRALSILGEPGSLRAALPYLLELH